MGVVFEDVVVVVVTHVLVTCVLWPSDSGSGVPPSASIIANLFSGLAKARPKKKLAIVAFKEGWLPAGTPV